MQGAHFPQISPVVAVGVLIPFFFPEAMETAEEAMITTGLMNLI